MKIEVDEKELLREVAVQIIREEREFFERASIGTLVYRKEVGEAVERKITEIIEENKDKILDCVVDKLAEKYMSQIKLAAVLAGLSKKE